MTGWNCAKVWRAVQLGGVGVAAVWASAWWHAGRPGVALAGCVWLLGGPAWALLLQGLWAAALSGADGPRAAVRWRAGAAELVWNLRVFGWQQPWRSAACPDTVAPTPRRGVLLVHGHLCNRAFWLPWLRWLQARGVPYATVSLWPMGADIDHHAPAIEAALQRLIALTGLPPLVLAHSKGGLSVRAWWRWCVQAGAGEAAVTARVHRVITLASPHQGTRLAQAGVGAAARQMAPGGAWLEALAAGETAAWRARLLCVASDADAVVYPPALAGLPGAMQHTLPGLAHIELAFDPAVQSLVWRALAAPAARSTDKGPW